MKKNEMKEIFLILENCYVNFFKDINDTKFEMMIRIWTERLKRYSKQEVMLATNRLVNKLKYMPSISDYIEELVLIDNPELLETAEEQYEIVKNAIDKSKYHYDNNVYINKLSREVVKEISYDNLEYTNSPVADRNRFIELYKAKISRFKTLLTLGDTITPKEYELLLYEAKTMQISNISKKVLPENIKRVIKKVEID